MQMPNGLKNQICRIHIILYTITKISYAFVTHSYFLYTVQAKDDIIIYFIRMTILYAVVIVLKNIVYFQS